MKFLIFALAILATAPAQAATLLHPMFADHAVLQRGAPIPVYGTAKPGAEVSLQLGTATASAHADAGGQWRTALPVLPAGGPYTLRATSGGWRPVRCCNACRTRASTILISVPIPPLSGIPHGPLPAGV